MAFFLADIQHWGRYTTLLSVFGGRREGGGRKGRREGRKEGVKRERNREKEKGKEVFFFL
jgi:hypothetical protein